MTTCIVQGAGTIELYFYDELDEGARAEAARHLATCAECRHAFDEMREIQAALATLPDVAAPPDENWAPFRARLEAAVRSDQPSAPSTKIRPLTAVRPSPTHHYAAYVAMAALLALVTMSVAYVIRYRAVTGAEIATASNAATGESKARPWTQDAAFAALSEQHFERSKLVVLGLASKNVDSDEGTAWGYEQELASTLLNDTRLYRLAAEERGMTALAKIMGDLELVLLQASSSGEPEAGTLQQIQSLIRKRDLVTRMNAVAVAGM
jgi:hypothetical protein